MTNEELRNEPKATNIQSYILGENDTQMIDQLPQVEAIGMMHLLPIDNFASRSDHSNYLVCIR